MRHVASLSVIVWTTSLVVGCPSPPAPADAGAPVAADAGALPSASRRPPYPNMATASYGQEVLDERVRALPVAAAERTKIVDVLDALHELTPGAEARAQELAALTYRGASTDAERGTAVALLAASLVLDPIAQGYKERLTDAFGLAAFAGTLDASDAVGQGARALVNASAGALAQADRLIDVVANTPHVTPEARIFVALARRITKTAPLDDAVLDMKETLVARPRSLRARAALAEVLLELGFSEDVIAIVDAAEVKDANGARPPWLVALHGRALVLKGDVAGGVALLREAESKLDEGRRAEALYWLGRSLTQTDAWASEVPPIAAGLAARDGFTKEARTLEALVALLGGDAPKAVATLKPLATGAARLPVDVDIAWLLVDACAGAYDVACVDDAGKRALALDGDLARLYRARATAAAAPAVGPSQQHAELVTQAERLSPFADDPTAARRLKGARKAIVRGASSLARAALAPHAKGCRVCTAVLAQAQTGKDAADSALAALAIAEDASPPLADADLVGVVDALGAIADERTRLALDALAKDARPAIQQAVAQARADHKDPDARRRREKGEHAAHPAHGPGGTK